MDDLISQPVLSDKATMLSMSAFMFESWHTFKENREF